MEKREATFQAERDQESSDRRPARTSDMEKVRRKLRSVVAYRVGPGQDDVVFAPFCKELVGQMKAERRPATETATAPTEKKQEESRGAGTPGEKESVEKKE